MFYPNARQSLFTFESDVFRGSLQPSGHRQGIRSLIHKPTGLSLVHPDFSLLNLYLIFATGQCIASARAFKRSVSTDGATVCVHCDPTHQHRAELNLTYRIAHPNAIDLVVDVCTRDTYRGYEALVSNYFDLAFKPQFCVSESTLSKASQTAHWYTPVAQHQHRDNALIFARDPLASQLHRDGRWSNYQWKTHGYYAYPIALQVHPEHRIALALMTRAEMCPSFSWTIGIADIQQGSYGSDHLDDPHKARNPIYASLFGGDFFAPQHYSTRIRLAVIPLDSEMSALFEAYDAFLSD
jgi:hypothetical protein